MIYEYIKSRIEMAFGAHKCGMEDHCVEENVEQDVDALNSFDDIGDIYFMLDGMTNRALCSVTNILTGGKIKFEKTNVSMKRTIRGLLPKVIAEKNDVSRMKLKQLSRLLNPKFFHGNHTLGSSPLEDYRTAAVKVLDALEDFTSIPLLAMHRKLKGVRDYIPSLQPKKARLGRDTSFARRVKKKCMKMLSDLSEVDEPPERLAAALGVAGLTLKLILKRPNVHDFRKFSPEMEALQNDIANAIHVSRNVRRVSLTELKEAQLLLDPNVKSSVRKLRTGVRNCLTEYLFECGDMDKVPDCLVETLNIINKIPPVLPLHRKHSSSKNHSASKKLLKEVPKEVIQKEVECVLAVSAQAKEVVLDLLPEHQFDKDFAQAYMEGHEGSDTLYMSYDEYEQAGVIPRHSEFLSRSSYDQTESMGETNPTHSNSSVSTSEVNCHSPLLSPNERLNVRLESMRMSETCSDETCSVVHSPCHTELKVHSGKCIDRKESPSGCTGEIGQAYSHSPEATDKSNIFPEPHSASKNSSHRGIKSEERTSSPEATPKFGSSELPEEPMDVVTEKSGNQYLEVQEACDAASMAAYHFVGLVLDKLAKIEGLNLKKRDRLYLHGGTSVPADSEETPETLSTSEFPGMWKDVLERLG